MKHREHRLHYIDMHPQPIPITMPKTFVRDAAIVIGLLILIPLLGIHPTHVLVGVAILATIKWLRK